MDKVIPAHILALLIGLSCGIISCSEKNAEAPDYNKVHAQVWVDPNYINTELFHGFQAEIQALEACMKCHEIYSAGEGKIPGCLPCHFDPEGSRIPIGSHWTHGRDDHEDFQKDQTVCNNCHEVGRRFNAGPGICHNCHGSGDVHVLGQPWLDQDSPQFHGDQSQEECANCHDLSTDCYQCHFGPTGRKSPGGWKHGEIDGHNDLESYRSVCDSCHALTQDYRNEPDPERCHDCHDD